MTATQRLLNGFSQAGDDGAGPVVFKMTSDKKISKMTAKEKAVFKAQVSVIPAHVASLADHYFELIPQPPT